MTFFKNGLKLTILFCLYSGITIFSISQAEDLYITDDYLKGLSEEVESPEYLTKAKDELKETEKLEQSQAKPSSQVIAATVDLDSFEKLLKTKYPSSYFIYTKLTAKSRLIVFKKFQTSKKLSVAKREIIGTYLRQ